MGKSREPYKIHMEIKWGDNNPIKLPNGIPHDNLTVSMWFNLHGLNIFSRMEINWLSTWDLGNLWAGGFLKV